MPGRSAPSSPMAIRTMRGPGTSTCSRRARHWPSWSSGWDRRRAGVTQAAAYGERIEIGDVAVTLVPAGHVLGSAQVVIEWKGARAVVSGDYKRSADPTCPAFELVPCDLFITEATFALPGVPAWRCQGRGGEAAQVAEPVPRAGACRRRLWARQVPAADRASARGGLRARRSICMARLPAAARSTRRSASSSARSRPRPARSARK